MADDNKLYINTSLDTKGVQKGAIDVKKIMSSLTNTAKRSLEKIKKSISECFKDSIVAPEYEALEKKLAKIEAQMQKIGKSQDRFLSTGGKKGSSTYKKYQYDLEQLGNEQDKVFSKMKQMESDGTAFTKGDGASEEIKKEGKEAEKSSRKLKLLGSVVKALKSAHKGLKGVVSRATNSFKTQKKEMGHSFKNVLKYAFGIRSLFVLFNKLRGALVEGFKNMAQFNNGVNHTNRALSSLKSALTQLKNSFASAFAPILTVVAPILTKFINMISSAVTYIGMFFAALTGQKTFTKAVAVQEDYAESLGGTADAAEDAAKAVKGYLSPLDEINKMDSKDKGGSNSGGSGGVSPNQMFEEVKVDSMFEGLADKFKKAWNEADFTEIGNSVGKSIKDGLDKIDWTGIKETCNKVASSIATFINEFVETEGLGTSLGSTLGESINTAVGSINTFLDKTKWDSVGKFIGDSLNSMVNTVDWKGIGHLFAQKWNDLFDVAGNFASTFDFSKFCSSLAGSVNQWAKDFNWEKNAKSLSDLAKGLLNTIVSLLENLNWQEIGNGVATFIATIDWSGIFRKLSEGIGAALGGLAAFILGLIKPAWDSVVKWWKEKAFEDGKFTIKGLLNGILEAIKNIGTWIKNNIFQPFINGFKKAFGIHSPSKVMAEQGGFIVSGLLNGIKELPSKVGSFFKKVVKSIKDCFKSIPDWFKNTFSDAWKKVKDVFSKGGKVFDGIKEGILSGLKSVINKLIQGINKVISIPFNGINDALKKIKNVSILGAKPFDFLPTISVPKIPQLATGAVIPPNAKFMAMLGDQKHGNNLEAPEGLIRKIVREESGNGTQTINLVVELDGKTVYKRVIDIAKNKQMTNGRNPFALA